MPTLSELAQQYVARLVTSNDSEREFRRIIAVINGLTYETNNRPISRDDKVRIVELIIEKLEALFPPRQVRLFESTEIVKAFSNDNYLELIRYIKDTIKK